MIGITVKEGDIAKSIRLTWYMPEQYVCEFVRQVTITAPRGNVDGISHRNGRSVGKMDGGRTEAPVLQIVKPNQFGYGDEFVGLANSNPEMTRELIYIDSSVGAYAKLRSNPSCEALSLSLKTSTHC